MTGSTGARLWAKARPETVAAASEARKARRSMNICNSSPMGSKLSRRLVLTATPWGRPGAISGEAWQTRHNSLSLAAAWTRTGGLAAGGLAVALGEAFRSVRRSLVRLEWQD